ncbi:type IV pilus modification protein PilV [Dyella monticola]|uniref:Type IV pilus modification protein PilV n=1 Tax=Dyella monticola TaxID=1927958 RepID=A0A370WXN4_9GAMM|nr:type IV pilus modification protein PilV [Dyella monticola]RDS80872.1 type IV pilus modification protein PilV [Dyella monticola]
MAFAGYQRGVTLIEILVAVLVFSIGLLGAAGLMAMAARSDQSAYLRTQVTFIAQNMVERMQANLPGVWNGDYNGTFPDASAQDCSGGCAPRQLALHDRQQWSSQLKTFLPPRATARIECTAAGLSHVPTREQILLRPPYGGNCTMTITWIERQVVDAKPLPQTFAWEFQP